MLPVVDIEGAPPTDAVIDIVIGTPWQPAAVVADIPCISHRPNKTRGASSRII
jgi:hypothetical protein